MSRVPTNGLTFQSLYEELEAEVQLDKESRVPNMKYKASNTIRDQIDDAVATNYAGQGQYINTRKHVKNRDDGYQHREDPVKTMFFTCDAPDHMAKDGTRPKYYAKATARQLEYHLQCIYSSVYTTLPP